MTDFIEQTFKRLARALSLRTVRDEFDLGREIDEEILCHVEMRAEDLMRGGLSREAALSEAHRAFGDPGKIRDQCLLVRKDDPVRRGFLQTVSAVQFAAGTALVMSVLFLAFAVMVREPLTFPAGGEWVLIGQSSVDSEGYRSNTTLDHFDRVSDRTDLFDRMTAARYVQGTLTGHGPPTQVRVKEVTSNYFEDHGVQPAAGKLRFGRAERPVILSYDLFESRYRGDPSVFGSTVHVDGLSHTIIGAVPESFQMFSDTDLFRPIPQDRIDRLADEHFLLAARLRTHVSPAEAERRLANEPAADPERHTVVRTVNSVYSSSVRPRVWLFLVVCGLTGLALAIPAARRPGSRRPGVVAAVAAGAALLTSLSVGLLKPIILGPYARLFDTAPGNIERIVFAVGALLLVLIMSAYRGISPDSMRRVGGFSTVARSAASGFALSAQMAVGIFVVSLAVQTISDQWHLENVEFGFDGSVYVSTFHLGAVGGKTVDRMNALGQFFEHIEATDGVTSASVTSLLPGVSDGAERVTLWSSDAATGVSSAAAVTSPGSSNASARLFRVGTDYFGTMGINVIEGDDFRSLPPGTAGSYIIVSRPLAELLWPNTSAIGRFVELPGLDEPLRVAGVVESHLIRGTRSLDDPALFVIAWRFFPSNIHVLVQSTEPPPSIARALRQATERVDENIAITPLTRVGRPFRDKLRAARLQTGALGLLAIMSLLLCTVAALQVAGRAFSALLERSGDASTHERMTSGLRTALTRPALSIVLPGLLAGIAVTCCARHVLPGPLADIAAPDLWVLVPATALILAAVAFAAYRRMQDVRLLATI